MAEHQTTTTRICQSCGFIGNTLDWPRYERNGRLTVCCAECNTRTAVDRPNMGIGKDATQRTCTSCKSVKSADQFKKFPSQTSPTCDPCRIELKRAARQTKAERDGRCYRTAETRRLHGAQSEVKQRESHDCSVAYRAFLDKYKLTGKERYAKCPQYAAKRRAMSRRFYCENLDRERQRVSAYKHANPDKLVQWGGKRVKAASEHNDGSLTHHVVGNMFVSAEGKRCPYCDAIMRGGQRSLDHIVPLSKGGAHSVVNVIICCRSCNSKKRSKEFVVWIESLTAKARARCVRIYRQRYGASPDQKVMELLYA